MRRLRDRCKHSKRFFSTWLIMSALFAGCGRGDRPELGTVTGTVTLDGEPLPNVELSFVPAIGRPSYGETDEEGNYELNYIRNIQGAKIGKHKVLIRSGKVDPDKIDPVEVSAGKNVIDIECKRVTKKPKVKDPDAEDDA